MSALPKILVLSKKGEQQKKLCDILSGLPTYSTTVANLRHDDETLRENIFVLEKSQLKDYQNWLKSILYCEEIRENTIIYTEDEIEIMDQLSFYRQGISFIASSATSPNILKKKVQRLWLKRKTAMSHKFLSNRLGFELEHLDEQVSGQNDLLQMAVHDLRSPLSAMVCYSELLMDGVLGGLKESHAESIKIIHQNCQFLIDMVNDLLDSAQLEAGKKQLKMLRTNINTLAKKVVRSLQSLAKVKDIEVQTHLENTPDMFADPQKLERIMINLLGNAIKFTKPKGTIHIRCFPKNNYIVLSIQDSGPGISDTDMRNIFDKFRIGDDSTLSGKGHGLGLTISKSFVELHGGKIYVKSERHKGSTFIVHLPIEKRLEIVVPENKKQIVILDLAGDLPELANVSSIGDSNVAYFTKESDWLASPVPMAFSCFVINDKYDSGYLGHEFFSFLSNESLKRTPCIILVPAKLSKEELNLYKYLHINVEQKPCSIDTLQERILSAIQKDRRGA